MIRLLNHSFPCARQVIYAGFLLIWSLPALSQDYVSDRPGKRKIELRNADIDIIVVDSTGKDLHRLLGNVDLIHNEVTMLCDSAHFSPDRNQVTAFSRVHIQQGDTLNLFGDYLFYDGKFEIATMVGNVELIDKETHLYTQAINYDVRNEIARYNDNGRITNAENTLTSIIGIYYVNQNLFHFKDSVKIVNPDYVITADTMDYNTVTEISYFTGPTELKGDSLYTYSERGWYDTKNDITSVWKNAVIDNRQQIVQGDSLYFNNRTGFGESFRNVVIQDTTNNLVIRGNYAWYYKAPEKFLVTDRAEFIQAGERDSMFLHADTLFSVTLKDKAGKDFRLMKAFHGCRIFSKDLQAKSDSLSYSFQDSVIRLYRFPVIWSEENQLTSDSMAVFTKNRQTDRLELYGSAFITSQVDSIRFNQIKGRSLTGFFSNNELYRIEIKGNGESIYYLLDGETVAGVDQAKCADIEVLVDKGKISRIFQKQNPEGTTDPPETGSPEPLRLKGFNWYDALRPKTREEIFKD